MPNEDDPDEHRIDLTGIMNDDLRRVEKAYGDHGERLWIVGGSVRDAIAGLTCNDVDLATTASPQKQAAICDASRLRWIGTGMDHGTITVLVGSSQYEITTLRRDVDADGRHAVVEWTPDVLDFYADAFSQSGAMRAGMDLYRAFHADAIENKNHLKSHGRCKVPAAAFNGAQSFLSSIAKEQTEELYENVEVIEVEESGHWVAEESPEDCVEKILTFVGKHSEQA